MRNVLRVLISGRVQGVGFRAWTVTKATSLGLQGWVRNTKDGQVEAVFSGEHEVINIIIEHCKQGPESARVDAIEVFTYKEDVVDGPFVAKQTV